jgi:MerR family transcriptional regulator, thiopeptide resistance regulator
VKPFPWRVGDLARGTGLSVRALHHYDEIGLLAPSHRTAAGHRLYTEEDVGRLQRIKSLRQLGFSLEEVKDLLDRPGFSLSEVIRLNLSRLREQIELQLQLRDQLETFARRLDSAGTVSVEEFLQTIEVMNMLEKYYTPEQLEALRERGRQIGAERIETVQNEWSVLLAEVKAAMAEDLDPASERARELARRWQALVQEFTGGDAGIERSVGRFYRENPEGGRQLGVEPEMFQFIGRVLAAEK